MSTWYSTHFVSEEAGATTHDEYSGVVGIFVEQVPPHRRGETKADRQTFYLRNRIPRQQLAVRSQRAADGAPRISTKLQFAHTAGMRSMTVRVS